MQPIMTLSIEDRAEQQPFTVAESGWLHGIWYCSTAWQKAKLHGQFPGNLWKRFRSLFPDVDDSKLLHLCSGTVQTPEVRMDISREFTPSVQANVEMLPFSEGQFDLVFIDPPYSKEDAAKYGVSMLNRKRTMAEARRVLAVGGNLAWLDVRYPSYRRKDWAIWGLIGVVTGFMRVVRVLSIFERLADVPTD
ncbi:hypothetical protein LCGC14_0491200 [marine sediment metagenome]|uniref:Methyltransferase type 11 domain-containing protein n=1 Tax=marine sediment metagenome TaxID=412755 RepID=A0A0F9SPY6_9ZZZZ